MKNPALKDGASCAQVNSRETGCVCRFANRTVQRFWRWGPLISAGMVFQATGCQINTSELTAGIVNSVLNQLITGFVFSAFNLVGP